MRELKIPANDLVSALLNLNPDKSVCILDSCGVGHLGSHLLIAGIDPVETLEIDEADPNKTLTLLDEKLSGDEASIFTLSYDFGAKLLGINASSDPLEFDIFLAQFDALIIHDYNTGNTHIAGNADKCDALKQSLHDNISNLKSEISNKESSVTSNFSRSEYLDAIEEIKERIRRGDTYQTNLTQQLTATLPEDLSPQQIFARLRRDHPAPFAAFIKRKDSTVVSASPERFFRVDPATRKITTSPIKGTRPRGENAAEDSRLKQELLSSPKDRAENTMIVDLLRNDLGRVCEYGRVEVEKLCELAEHPSLFHLVSTVGGKLRNEVKPSDIIRAVFPCGSITGAPKISTMQIIDEIEKTPRGLSMGAIGYYLPDKIFGQPETLDLSVAIRTMVIRGQTATFNVGGGIVIDSDPQKEWEETLVKAKALFQSISAKRLPFEQTEK